MNKSLLKSTIDINSFKPFGSLITIGNERRQLTINNGYCKRFDEIAPVEIEDNEHADHEEVKIVKVISSGKD